MKFLSASLNALIVCLIGITSAQNSDSTPPNPVFWEYSFTMNTTNSTSNNAGTINQSTSFTVSSQDFQGIYVDRMTSYSPPARIVFNFGESCRSSNTTIETLQALNQNGILLDIQNASKVALVKRGNCNWSEKIATVNSFSKLLFNAVFIYDNDTHGDEIKLASTQVVRSTTVRFPEYSTPLPTSRNVKNMMDNDLSMMSSSPIAVYFIPFEYGDAFVKRINASFNSSIPEIRQYWSVKPFIDDPSSNSSNFFSSGRGYLSYIIALAALFIIGIIFLRWWRIRRMRRDFPNGFNGFSMANGFNMQPRVNRLDPLPVDIVNALPIEKYSEDLIKNTNCAICLEDFVPAKNDIRILPCGHGFCVLCIDPWLTQKSTMCPICKWDCLPVDLRRERNEQLQQQQQQQQLQQGDEIPHGTSSPNSHTINMDVPGPSTPAAPSTVAPSQGNIIPPTLLPASSPPLPPSPSSFAQNEITREENEKASLPSVENPFETTNESHISHSPSESSRSPRTTTPPPAFTEADMASEKKGTH